MKLLDHFRRHAEGKFCQYPPGVLKGAAEFMEGNVIKKLFYVNYALPTHYYSLSRKILSNKNFFSQQFYPLLTLRLEI